VNIGVHFDGCAKKRISQTETSGECNSIISVMGFAPPDLRIRVPLLQEARSALE
jgi:hypothetical protein